MTTEATEPNTVGPDPDNLPYLQPEGCEIPSPNALRRAAGLPDLDDDRKWCVIVRWDDGSTSAALLDRHQILGYACAHCGRDKSMAGWFPNGEMLSIHATAPGDLRERVGHAVYVCSACPAAPQEPIQVCPPGTDPARVVVERVVPPAEPTTPPAPPELELLGSLASLQAHARDDQDGRFIEMIGAIAEALADTDSAEARLTMRGGPTYRIRVAP